MCNRDKRKLRWKRKFNKICINVKEKKLFETKIDLWECTFQLIPLEMLTCNGIIRDFSVFLSKKTERRITFSMRSHKFRLKKVCRFGNFINSNNSRYSSIYVLFVRVFSPGAASKIPISPELRDIFNLLFLNTNIEWRREKKNNNNMKRTQEYKRTVFKVFKIQFIFMTVWPKEWTKMAKL